MNSKFKLFLISFIVLTLVPNIIQIGSAAYSNIPTKFRLPFSGAYYSPTVYQYYDNDTTAGIKSYGCGSKTYNNHKGTDFNVNVDTPIYAAAQEVYIKQVMVAPHMDRGHQRAEEGSAIMRGLIMKEIHPTA